MIKGKHFVVFIITMPNPVSYNSSTTPTGTFKRSNISYGLIPTNYGVGYGSLSWYNSLDTTSKYVIVSDTYTLGFSTQGNAKPVMWSTGNTSNQNLINLINGMPGNTTNFTDYYAAVNWLQGTNNFLLLNNGYENIVTNGLVLNVDAGWWSSYPTSATTWTDLSGNENNGTLINSPTYNSSNNGSIVFDGVDDYISIVGVNSLFEVANATFTVNMWVYAYAIQTRMGLWGKNDAYEFGFISSGSIQFWSPGGTFSVAIVDSNYLNQWKMITSINSPQGSYVYSNGVLIGYGGQLSGVGGSSFAIGSGFDPPGTNTFNGRIGITQIYNRALTETEILLNYNAQKGRFGL